MPTLVRRAGTDVVSAEWTGTTDDVFSRSGPVADREGIRRARLMANGVRSSINEVRRLSYGPLDVFGLPLLVTFVC
jgi:hypothetical protein